MKHDGCRVSTYAVLLHLTHYDPAWMEWKETETRFDYGLMDELIDLLTDAGFNAVILDIADAVQYQSHPDLKRAYTVSINDLARIADKAHSRGLEVIPKLNFAKSDRYMHNWWFRPYCELPDNREYFEHAWDLIDEILGVVTPARRFHIGMDEDTVRNVSGYCRAIETFRTGLDERGFETIMWSDVCLDWGQERNQVLDAAFQRLSREITMVLWCYQEAKPKLVRRFVELGYPVWGAHSGEPRYRDIKNDGKSVASEWAEAVRSNGGVGLLATLWLPVQPKYRSDWEKLILSSARDFGLS